MERKIDRIWGVVVCALFIIIFGATLWNGKDSIKTNLANAYQQEENVIKEALVTIDEVYTEQLCWHDELARLDCAISWFSHDKMGVNSTRVMIGKDGWMFYKLTLEDYLGTRRYSDAELTIETNHFLERESFYESKGCEFVLFFAPNKIQVYDDYAPAYYERSSTVSRVGDFVEHLKKETDINVLYPLEELKSYRDEYQLYYKYDTHWNTIGAYIGVEEIVKALGYQMTPIEDSKVEAISYEPHECALDDLAYMVNLEKLCVEDKDYKVVNSFEMEYIETESSGIYRNPEALIEKKVLLFRDSFGAAMVPHLLNNFSEVYEVHYSVYSDELIEQYQPDIVIYEVVEREIDYR